MDDAVISHALGDGLAALGHAGGPAAMLSMHRGRPARSFIQPREIAVSVI